VRVDRGFEELYRSEFQTVFRAVFALCGDASVAEEATQEAFARALARWRRLRDRTWAGGWVTTTAMNVARRSLRRRPTAPTPPPEELDVDASVDLWRQVRALPARQQEAVILHYVLDLRVDDSAAAMGCEGGTVKAHLARARATLRTQLEETHDDR
jgi:RNA polymerase sigma-70 factor, ECF subfamily